MTAEERAARAISIRALLEDQNIKDAFASIETDLTAEWRRSFTPEERENCWKAINIMDRLRTWLHSSASSDLTALRRAK